MSARTAAAPMMIIKSPLKQLMGFGVMVFALFLAISLMTYNSADPALNHATAEAATNAGGLVGAYISDVLLQILGLASLFAALVPMSWGAKMMTGRSVSFVWLRFSVLLFALVFTAFLFASVEAPVNWPIASGLGGSIGALLHDMLKTAKLFPIWWVGDFALAAFTTLIAFGMSFGEWRTIGRSFRYVAMVVVGLYYTIRYRNHCEDEDEEYEDEYEESFLDRAKEKFFFWRAHDEDEEYEDDEDDEDDEEEEDAAPRKKKKRKVVEKKIEKKAQSSLALPKGDFSLPSISLLANAPKSRKAGMNESALEQNARLLESVLEDFNVQGQITEIRPGPVVTLYELEPAAGTKSSRVVGLSDDIARSMSSLSARIAVIPGRNAIGIELPNAQRETVYFRELLETETYDETEASLPLALGKDISGETVIVDLAKMPHLLVAGTTGSGKSVAINTMIMSLLYKLSPEECKFIMIDPKMLELSVYEGIPHLLTSVVTEPGKAVVALKWTVKEMENRYRLMANLGVRNIESYNKQIREAKAKGKQLTRPVQTGFDSETGRAIIEEVPLEMNELPYIVVIVDEMADLMIVAGKDIESSIQRLAQMARAAGIHLIMATQRPSVDVITGVIKANFPTRISFQVTSRIDSRTILGDQGAEQLLGQGDMLYMAGGGRITRVHGPFVADKEVEQVVAYLKTQGEPTYIEEVTKDDGEDMNFGEDGERDELYEQAVAIVKREQKASVSYIQRQLRIGYNRAAMIIERMEKQGIVGPASAMGKREIIG